MARYTNILKNRNFFLLWIGQIISQFGDRLTQMALIGLVYARTPGSAFALAKAMLFVIIPVFFIGPVAGVYVDRWDRKRTMIFADILRAFLVLLIPICFVYLKLITPIYILVFLVFSTTRFFLSSKLSIVPDLVPEQDLLKANSLISTTRIVASIFALVPAGLLVGMIGSVKSFYIDSVTYIASAVALVMITTASTVKIVSGAQKQAKLSKRSYVMTVISQFGDAIKLVARTKEVRYAFINHFVLMSGVGGSVFLILTMVQDVFKTATFHVSVLGTFLVLGLLSGALVYGRTGHRFPKRRALPVSFLASGIMIGLLSLSLKHNGYFALTGAAMFFAGAAISPVIIAVQTIIHEAIAQDIRGRVFSSLEALIHMGFLVCMLASTKLAEVVDGTHIVFFWGAVFVAFGIIESFKNAKAVK